MIHVPIMVESIHWILRVVNLSAMQIYIYDFIRLLHKPNKLKKLVTSLTMLLSRLLNAVKYYGKNGDLKKDIGWKIEILNGIPQ